MARYTLILRNDDSQAPATRTDADWQALMREFVTWTDDLHDRGICHAVQRLLDPQPSRTVRNRQGTLTVDGPYAEGKEAVLGFYVIEAADYDQATEIAREVPFLQFGGMVEVRELGDFPAPSGR